MSSRVDCQRLPNGDIRISVLRDRRRGARLVVALAGGVVICEIAFAASLGALFGWRWPSTTMWLGWGLATAMVVGIFLVVGLTGAAQKRVTFVAGSWGVEVQTTQSGDPVRKRFSREVIRGIDASTGLAIRVDEGTYPYLIEERNEILEAIAKDLRESVWGATV